MPGVKEAGRLRGAGKEEVQAWIAPIESFVIGDERISNAPIVVTDLGVNGEMLLGMDFLQAHRMLIAHSQKKIYFTYSGGPVFQSNPAQEARSGPTPEASATPLPGSR